MSWNIFGDKPRSLWQGEIFSYKASHGLNTERRGDLAGLGQLWSLVTPGGGGYSLHLSVTWSRLESGLGAYKCKEGTRNQFVTGFEKVLLYDHELMSQNFFLGPTDSRGRGDWCLCEFFAQQVLHPREAVRTGGREFRDPGDRPERGAGGAGRDDPGLQGRDVHHGAGPRPRRPRQDQVTLASDWSEQVTWLNYWPLIGRDRSRDLYNGLLLVRNRRRASLRSRLGTDDQTGLAGHHQTGTRPCTGSNSSPSSWTPSCQSPSTSVKTWPDIMWAMTQLTKWFSSILGWSLPVEHQCARSEHPESGQAGAGAGRGPGQPQGEGGDRAGRHQGDRDVQVHSRVHERCLHRPVLRLGGKDTYLWHKIISHDWWQGRATIWDRDEGGQVELSMIIKMDTITGCEGVGQNPVITDIALPLVLAAVKSDFTNIGSVLGAIGCRQIFRDWAWREQDNNDYEWMPVSPNNSDIKDPSL